MATPRMFSQDIRPTQPIPATSINSIPKNFLRAIAIPKSAT